MSYAEDGGGSSPFKWVGLGFLALVAVFTLGRMGISDLFTNLQTSPASIEREIEREFASQPGLREFYETLETKFPVEHERFIALLSERARARDNPAQLHTAGFDFMQEMMVAQIANLGRAPDAEIDAIIDSQLDAAIAIAARSPTLCAHYTMDGLTAADRVPRDLQPALLSAATTALDAAAAGRDSPVEPVPSTEADWELLVDAMMARGTTEEHVDALFMGTYSALPDSDQCDIGINFMQALADVDEAAGIRLMRDILVASQAAR